MVERQQYFRSYIHDYNNILYFGCYNTLGNTIYITYKRLYMIDSQA